MKLALWQYIDMQISPLAPEPLNIHSPPDAVPSDPPVTTRDLLLPFGALSWQNFEKLCERLTALDGDVEYCARYGQQGEAQEGIDIYARLANGRYHCVQAKRHSSFGPAKLCDAVDLFLGGSWADRALRFTIAVQAQLRTTALQEEIERQVVRLNGRGIAFDALDAESLTDRLRAHPTLVDDFFGRPWVVALLGTDVANALGARLDGAEFAKVRSQLAKVYEAQFHTIDPGSFGSIDDDVGSSLALLNRFFKPDILVREKLQTIDSGNIDPNNTSRMTRGIEGTPQLEMEPNSNRTDPTSAGRTRRLPLVEWLGDQQRLVLLGEAGSGKSTLLRVIALDLLHHQEHFSELAKRWGQHIPIYIPFARWSALVARDDNAIGIKEIVRGSLDQFLTTSIADLLDRSIDDRRILLLIDGLDEWSNVQAAKVTLNALVTLVQAHGIPVVVSGRPRGLNRIGGLPAEWRRGTVAPLSKLQQFKIANSWFERYATATSNSSDISEGVLRTNRFIAELARDANLGALASVPLLLVGLITLALRGQILPRTRGKVYDELVTILLEVHPENRAVASGNTVPRFQHATEPGLRRAAISRLALAVREQAGGAGIPKDDALKVLRQYFLSPEGFNAVENFAGAAANEILSVNSETQGLIIEKAPGEVGFVHASFEEYLGAEYISGLPFEDIKNFVRTHAGESRWRNVITNLLGFIQRRDEFNQLIEIIEEPANDELLAIERQTLLGDIAFGTTMRSPDTNRRLAFAAMERVEIEDWLPARREALASVLKGLSDPMLKTDVEKRLRRWLPDRYSYRSSLIEILSVWQPSQELQDLFFRAMHDTDPNIKRAGAAAFANVFSSSVDAFQRLLVGLTRSRDCITAAAMLESLALGWPKVAEVLPLFEEARKSQASELRLIGTLGLAISGNISDEERGFVLHSQSYYSGLSYAYRNLAIEMLIKYWPRDESLLQGALLRISHSNGTLWEYDAAFAYLMKSPIENADVRNWILKELRNDHPFNTGRDLESWVKVGKIAAVDAEVRAAATAYWCKSNSATFYIYNLPGYVENVADEQILKILIDVLADLKSRFGRYWALTALLKGWGRDHPSVKPILDALAAASDEELFDLASLVPQIISNQEVARERLIRLGTQKQVRRDLLTTGLAACGCGANDNEAVSSILAFPEGFFGPYSYSTAFFSTFGAHADVRAFALERVRELNGPLTSIATAYANDPEFVAPIFDAATPLPVDLRTQIIEIASSGAPGTALEMVLSQGMLENDPELCSQMVIAHHRTLRLEERSTAQSALLSKAVSIGPNYESFRAAALAGLATIGALDSLASLEDVGKPVAIRTSNLSDGIVSVQRLVCERFSDFQVAFGDSLEERFESSSNGRRVAEILSVAPGASPAARAAFLSYAERGEIPRTPQALRALAVERPSSELLLFRCFDALKRSDRRNDTALINSEVALILREHFAGNEDVRAKLVELFAKRPSAETEISLAIFAPESSELRFSSNFDGLGHQLADWAVAVHKAVSRADSATFCNLLETMVSRPRLTNFDAQHITNLAVGERLQRDTDLEAMMSVKIAIDVDPSVSGSFARYLAAAGKLSTEVRSTTVNLLQDFQSKQRLPVTGYDAIADQWRAVRATLLDAISAGIDS
ncbi:NACHT domain-containing protein [Undibacterium pigrum]|uniref:NACHT domain-containing protein n=1 Tax=Undibacterium pigrum TaxID=401470 RepID=A0A318JHU7_9BURK|nr:NACHT domain-containing protein [Undibacterium pigrum]PXX46969.1 NACHT domain-containing protein [Undibacterium pigrum]